MTDVVPRSVEPGSATSSGVARRPTPVLRPYVNRYLGYRQVGFGPGHHRLLPSRFLTVLVSIGAPIDVVTPIASQAPDRYDVVLGGLQGTSATIAHDGSQEGVWVELTPLGCRCLLDVPARALWNTTVEAADVLGCVAVELRERLHLTTDWSSRFDIVDEVFARCVSEGSSMPPDVHEAWRLLVASEGAVSIRELAAVMGWSRQHLTRRFRAELGYSPKLAARVIRFDRARRMLQQAASPTLTEVATGCGYYDQSHLHRDFVELVGCPPNDWIAAEVPFIQYSPAAHPARSTT